MLKDVLETDGSGVIKNHGEWNSRDEKSMCVDANYHKGVDNHGQRTMIQCGAIRGRYIVDGKRQDKTGVSVAGKTTQRIEVRSDEKTNTLTTVQKDNVLIVQTPRGNNTGGLRALDGKTPSMTSNSWQHNNHLQIRDKSKCVRSSGRGSVDRHEWDSIDSSHVHKLTPIECERLQTFPDNYTDHVSNTQRYKALGNSWTVEVIAHIFRNLPDSVSFL